MDLSKVLGDVYDKADSSREAVAPDWADEARLDKAFASWTPGPPADAPAAEREMAGALDHDLATALSGALVADSTPSPSLAASVDASGDDAMANETYVEVARARPEPAADSVRIWSRADDDVLPGRHRRRLLSRRSR